MLYRINASSKEVIIDIMQKLNTVDAGFLMYWYSFDYVEKGTNGKKLTSQGWFINLSENNRDLAVMASVLYDYVVMVASSWNKNHEKYMATTVEDEEYFDATVLYIADKRCVSLEKESTTSEENNN